MARNETATVENTETAATVENTPAVDPIEAAKAAVTVQGTDRKRALRDAALNAAASAYGPFTIAEVVSLPNTEPKFKAWISGARGRNGFIITLADGRRAVVGGEHVMYWNERGMVTNFDEFVKVTGSAATMVGILA